MDYIKFQPVANDRGGGKLYNGGMENKEKRPDLILVLDQGTTSSRALLIDRSGAVVASSRQMFEQIYPKPGWVEHDPMEILSSQLSALTGVLAYTDMGPERIAGIGITNQRETTILWDRDTGRPLANAIVWQCRRTAGALEQLCKDPAVPQMITERTGLVPDAYFSASKIAWLLDNIPGARGQAERGRLAFGTVDSWLIYSLTGGRVHATDFTNASRTMLFNIHEGRWDEELLRLFGIPASLMPEVCPSACDFGDVVHPSLPKGLRICGVAGDQQAALFGQRCFSLGEAKCTLGTGAFLLMHTGGQACASRNRLVTTIAASPPGKDGLEYALEGSIFVAGALIEWLKEGLGVLGAVEESEELASRVPDTAGVFVVPAFTGLGAPWWDPDARGTVTGLTRGARKEHIVRAALESLAYQSADLISSFCSDAGVELRSLKADGGASANGFLMQFMADILGMPVVRPDNPESTGLGAAFLAGLSCGFWDSLDEIMGLDLAAREFVPGQIDRQALMDGWREAVGMTRAHS